MARGWRCAACVVILVLAAGTGGGRVEASAGKKDDERRAEYERFVEKMMDSMPADELAEELVGVIHRTMDSERRERRKKEIQRDFDMDDEALLERIGRLVVQWVNTRLTPRTDDECKWNWGRWRCDPQCSCVYKYRFGDYAPGRSCRLRPPDERDLDTCDPEAGNEVSLLEKLAAFVGRSAKRTWRFTAENVIPQTDKDCRFSLAHSLEEKRFVCSPRKSCAFHYKSGKEFSRGVVKPGTGSSSSNNKRGGGSGSDNGGSWSRFDGGGNTGGSDEDEDDDDDDMDDREGGFFEYEDDDYLL
eukprot:jgi/Undpi1/8651/HiC_scaffold_25.g11116.m1